MKIKAASLGRNIEIFTLLKGTLLGDFLKKWHYPRKDETVSINGIGILDFYTPLKNNDIVVIAWPIKGGLGFKKNGIWEIHQDDSDNKFPSDFHAHRVDEPEKLDIYTGKVYDTRTRLHIYNLSKSHMRAIFRELLRNSKEGSSIRKRLNNKDKFTYLN